METALAGALEHTLASHAKALVATERRLRRAKQAAMDRRAKSLVQTAEAAARQQAESAKHTEVLLKVIDATNQIAQLEQTLNRNLSALGGSRNFDETLVALSAAVQLLSARLGQVPGDMQPVNLGKPRRTDKAA